MRQKELLDETLKQFEVSDSVKTGIKYHQSTSENILSIFIVLFVGVAIHYYFFGIETAGVFGIILFLLAFLFELYLRKKYGYTEKKAVKYYIKQMYENPSLQNLEELQSWNKNPFNIETEYHYPVIGNLVEEAFTKENPVEFMEKELPDTIRLLEVLEDNSYNKLVDLDEVDEEDLQLTDEYQTLIREINYTYKLGSYTSTSILIRKLADNLIRDILFAKGLYQDLGDEPTLEEKISLLSDEVLAERYTEQTREIVVNSLDEWVRKKGNKGAHILEEFEKEEIEDLMENAQNSIRILLVIRSEVLEHQ